MKRFTFTGILFSILVVALPSPAQTISPSQQHPQMTVSLYRGQGVTLNFRPTGETIQRAWLDDPSQTTLDFDDASCSAINTSEGCAASVIHLRRINPVNFPGLPTTDVTSLTVLTDNNLYSFRLTFPDTGSPSYTVLNIEPESERNIRANIRPQLTQAERLIIIENGLEIARSRNMIATDDLLWQRTQIFLSLMRDGVSAQAAAKQAGISQELITRLAELGQTNLGQTDSEQTDSTFAI
ncbi:MAG: hypothetical protein WA949_10465 [Phormidesmis sp.]